MNESEKVSDLYIKKDTLSARIDLHKKYSTNTFGWHNWVFDQFVFRENMKVLELGCGTGDIWIGKKKRIPKTVQVLLTDISPLMSQKARANIERSKRFSFQLMDIQNIPFDDSEFDMVIANHILYHVQDLNKALLEIKRVLKNEGSFYSTTTGEKSLEELNTMYRQYDGKAKFTYVKNIPFTLENGENVLNTYFERVEKRIYRDSLEVTDADDLMDYITSYNDIPEDVYHEMYGTINREIIKNGAFRIKKEQGMFVCKK